MSHFITLTLPRPALLQKPSVVVQGDVGDGGSYGVFGGSEMHMASCGILANTPPEGPSPVAGGAGGGTPRSQSDGALNQKDWRLSPSSIAARSPTPEIFVSGEVGPGGVPGRLQVEGGLHGSPGGMRRRVRKISHSSEEIDMREDGGETAGTVARASSATDLQLPLQQQPQQEDSAGAQGALSPLLAPLSSLGSLLAPGANKLARGMQSIGSNLDPRRLRQARQQGDQDPEMLRRKQQCRTKIIQI